MGNVGFGELVLIFLVALLVFGAKRLPEIARGLGQGIREFKDATSGIKRELEINDDYSPRLQEPPRYVENPQPPFTEPVITTPAVEPPATPEEPSIPSHTL